MDRTTYAVDIAKHVMQLHWVDAQSGEIGRKKLGRTKLAELFVQAGREFTQAAFETDLAFQAKDKRAAKPKSMRRGTP